MSETPASSALPADRARGATAPTVAEEHFKPRGTVFVLVMFVAALVLLWLSVYVILLSRGVTT